MNKLIYTLVILAFTVSVNAQWQSDVRLTNDPASSSTSRNNAKCILAIGNIVHTVWHDNRDGNNEIYYKRSTDGGTSWGSDVRLTNNAANSLYPSLAVSATNVHVVWQDTRDTEREIYYKRSTDAGMTWEADSRLSDYYSESWNPSIAVYGSNLHVVWQDTRDNNREIYYKRSTDTGITWETDIRLTINGFESSNPSISVSGSNINIVWNDYRDAAGTSEIYYKRSTDGGISWETDLRLTNNISASLNPSIADFDSNIHIVWVDQRDGNPEIYYKYSTDAGITWGTDIRLTTNTVNLEYPSIAVLGPNLHIVWVDRRDANPEIYHKYSTDAGITWGTDTRVTSNPATSGYPFISVSGSNLHLVWLDNRDGNSEIYYKRNNLIPSEPILLSPANYSIGLPNNLNLVWNKPQHSTKYRLLLATDSLFTNIIVNDSLLTDSVKNVSNLNPLTNYFWKVSAGNTAGWSNYSSVYKFRTIGSPTQVNLFFPANNSLNQPLSLVFRWYKAIDQTVKSNRAVSSYWLEYSADSTFQNGVFKDSTLTDSLKSVTGLSNTVKYYWRVKAKNTIGWGNYSAVWNFTTEPPLGITQIGTEIPSVYSLSQNYPNPFNPVTKIRFDVPRSENVVIKVYDILGKEITTLVNQHLQPGTYETDWDASGYSSGIYYYKITGADYSETKKMVLVK